MTIGLMAVRMLRSNEAGTHCSVTPEVLVGTSCEGLTGGDSGLPERPFLDVAGMQCFHQIGAKKQIPRFVGTFVV
jgi:hypothetical protein